MTPTCPRCHKPAAPEHVTATSARCWHCETRWDLPPHERETVPAPECSCGGELLGPDTVHGTYGCAIPPFTQPRFTTGPFTMHVHTTPPVPEELIGRTARRALAGCDASREWASLPGEEATQPAVNAIADAVEKHSGGAPGHALSILIRVRRELRHRWGWYW